MSFNLNIATECADTIAAMYRGELSPTVVDGNTDTQVRVVETHSREFLLVFPGSASLRDWRTNAQARKTEWFERAKTHHGFTEAYQSVGPLIIEMLAARRVESVTITGHSLGGALATLCADSLADAGIEIAGVYTFGSPRVGNRAFALQYNEDLAEVTHRIVNARDPVPWLPFPLPVPRSGIYTHVDTIVYLPHDGGIEYGAALLSHLGDAAALLQSQAQEQTFFGDVLTARCHNIGSYLGKLKGLRA